MVSAQMTLTQFKNILKQIENKIIQLDNESFSNPLIEDFFLLISPKTNTEEEETKQNEEKVIFSIQQRLIQPNMFKPQVI